jgi:hypothetical protein
MEVIMRNVLIGSTAVTIAAIVLLSFALRHVPNATAKPESATSVDTYSMQSKAKNLPEQTFDDLI